MAVEEIERHLRNALGKLDPDLLANAPQTAPAHQSDLWTFHRYRQFLDQGDDVWLKLPKDQLWSRINRRKFRNRLQEANKARNRAFHFRTDGLTAEEAAAERSDDADQLAQFARCLRIITSGHRC